MSDRDLQATLDHARLMAALPSTPPDQRRLWLSIAAEVEEWLRPEPEPESLFGGDGGDFECCASGRCEVCSPGYVWGRDG